MDTPKKIIKDIQAHTDLSDEAIAELVGSSQPTIWRIRNGKTKNCESTLYAALHALREERRKTPKPRKPATSAPALMDR